jgi:hypothetical protein
MGMDMDMDMDMDMENRRPRAWDEAGLKGATAIGRAVAFVAIVF